MIWSSLFVRAAISVTFLFLFVALGLIALLSHQIGKLRRMIDSLAARLAALERRDLLPQVQEGAERKVATPSSPPPERVDAGAPKKLDEQKLVPPKAGP
ncbi:MAG: hypothetical protein H0T83_02470, partial [Chthoniobacterales bacterium]|nr:hypothetical protein [Chthoniobacterales bacterium]